MASITVDVCLFDLDGTIIDSTFAAESAWKKLCSKYGVDPEEFFKHSHGSRTEEMLARFFPSLDNTDNAALKVLELSMANDYLDSVHLIPGAEKLLLSLDVDTKDNRPLVNRKWAIVTSGSPHIAFTWFKTILKKVGKPKVFITGFDVSKGKPDPEGYSKARDELCKLWDFVPSKVKTVVFEDAPVGIKAGKAIGAITIGITTSYNKQVLFAAGADYVVSDLTSVTVSKNTSTSGITLEITNALAND